MQIHMRRLIKVTKDIDGFKEIDMCNSNTVFIGEVCNGRKPGILQTDDY